MFHGVSVTTRGLAVPRSVCHDGQFGRMFHQLRPFEPPGKTSAERETWLTDRAEQMFDPNEGDEPVNLGIPAAYTYLGQFIAHDLSLDLRGIGERAADPDRMRSFRTPRLDLDSVYGAGPQGAPYLYGDDREVDGGRGFVFRIQRVRGIDSVPRVGGTPVTADPRNTSHYITEQLHLAVMKFHNRAMRELAQRGMCGAPAFHRAQELTRWHYQWVVVDDFLRRLVPWDEFVQPHMDGLAPGSVYQWERAPFIPVEFSAAAFRFGHSMVRSNYRLNRTTTVPFAHLLPGARVRLPEIVWRYLLGSAKGQSTDTHYSRLLGTKLSPALARLPDALGLGDQRVPSLAARDLLRGWQLGLPSGQAVARSLGLQASERSEDPLWIYVLQEANQQGSYGTHLGPVGARIVADVFMGLLWGDPGSWLRQDRSWRPTLGHNGSRFMLRDFLQFAGMAMDDG